MPNFLAPPVDPPLRKFSPQIRPKMRFGAWRWRGAQWPKTVFWCSFCAAGPEFFSPPAGPLMAGEAVPCGATSAPRRVPALIATGPRDKREALVPACAGTTKNNRNKLLIGQPNVAPPRVYQATTCLAPKSPPDWTGYNPFRRIGGCHSIQVFPHFYVVLFIPKSGSFVFERDVKPRTKGQESHH